MANQLPAIKHIVQLMLENRSFDQMLGFLYNANGNKSSPNQPYEGLTGNESNPDDTGRDPHPHPATADPLVDKPARTGRRATDARRGRSSPPGSPSASRSSPAARRST